MDNKTNKKSIEETLKLLAELDQIPDQLAHITVVPLPALYEQAVAEIRQLKQRITHEQALRDQLHRQLQNHENPDTRDTLP